MLEGPLEARTLACQAQLEIERKLAIESEVPRCRVAPTNNPPTVCFQAVIDIFQ